MNRLARQLALPLRIGRKMPFRTSNRTKTRNRRRRVDKGDSSSDSADYPSGGDPEKDLGDIGMDDVDDSVNKMCKKVYTVFRSIPKTFSCPTAQRDNMADQFTPQDDLLTMEKTVRDFLKLEGKIYDP